MMPPSGRHSPLFPSVGHAVLLVLAGLTLQMIAGVGLAVAAALVGSDWNSGAQVLFDPWALIMINVGAFGAILAFGLRITRESAADFFAIKPFSVRLLPALLLASLGLAVVLAEADSVILEILQALSWPGGIPPELLNLEDNPGSGFLLLVIVAPLTEEYLFRGMILRGLLTRHRPAVAIGLTALLFGLVHANLRQLFLGLVIGGVFGWWYARTRSIGPCLIGHAVFNAVAWFALTLSSELPANAHPTSGPAIEHLPWWLTVSGLGAAALGLGWFARAADSSAPPAFRPVPPPAEEPPLLPVPADAPALPENQPAP